MSPQVSSIISKCDTGLAKGLSVQIIKKMNRMVHTPILVEVKHPLIYAADNAVNLYLQPQAFELLIHAVNKAKKTLVVNSMFRTIVQQHVIRKQYERGYCGITAAANPGTSNHEQGLAIDIQDPHQWQDVLESYNWIKLGSWDDMHYDYWDGKRDVSTTQCFAFQQLWNQYNPKNLIPVDGVYGPKTAKCIDLSPIDGWK